MKKLEVKVYRWEEFMSLIEENKDDLIEMGIDAEKILQYNYKTRKMIDGSETDFPTSLAHTFVKNLLLTEARQHGRIFPESQIEIAKHFMLPDYEEIRVQLEEAYNEAKSQSQPRKTRKPSVRGLKTKLSRAFKDEDRELAHKLVDEIFDFTEDEDEVETEEVEVELVEDSDEAPEPENEEETEVEEETEKTEIEEMAEAIEINVQNEEEETEPEVKKAKNMKICVVCGKEYKAKSPKQKYCSQKCRKNK